jgi:endonuclease/exonuclease/phosphatase family metal-dependent hydrolase
MDPDKPALRLCGNGPPFAPERRRAYNVDDLSFSRVTVAEDQGSKDPPDSRVVTGDIDAGHLHDKITYNGVRYLDTVDAPDLKLDEPQRRINYPGKRAAEKDTMYLYNLFFADYNAYDLGMINRTFDNTTLPKGYTDKGIIENHRWVDPAESGDSSEEWRSIRNVVDRHQKGVRHRVLYQNLGLQPDRPHSRDDAEKFGKRFGTKGFDIAAVCELYGKGRLKRMRKGYETSYSGVDRKYFRPEHCVMVGYEDESPAARRIVHSESSGDVFQHAGPGLSAEPVWGRESWLRAVIEVPPLRGNPKFEVYLTHLQPVPGGLSKDKRQQAKINQMRELAGVIRTRNENDQVKSRPKIVLGDFNIHSSGRPGSMGRDSGLEKGEYFSNLMHQMHSVGMQDVWLTYGGPGNCSDDPDGYLCSPFPSKEGDYRGGRLDYIFLKKPRPYHELHIDVSRTKLVKWPKSGSDFPPDAAHKGIAFDILTSPAGSNPS